MQMIAPNTFALDLPEVTIAKTRILYPLSVNAVKRHLRLDNDFVDDDAYIGDLIQASTQLAEAYINKAIAYTKNVMTFDNFIGNYINVKEGNFLSLESVKDGNDVSVGTVKSTSIHYDFFTVEWNETLSIDPMVMTFYTGYAEDETPAMIKQAILIKCADLYDNSRTSLIYSGLTDSKVFEALLNQYCAYQF